MITIHSFKLNGIDAVPVNVEVEIKPGIGIHLIGLADTAVKESLLRTVTALQSLGYKFPGKKVIINLAPADLCKGGTHYDLPIALGIIGASGQETLSDVDKYVIAGELGLDGHVRDIPGWMQAAEQALKDGRACILPTESAKLAACALGDKVNIYGVDDLREAIDILKDGAPEWTARDECDDVYPNDKPNVWDTIPECASAKRAMEIAVAGGHPILLMGAPGTGKSMLAIAALDIMPPMSGEEVLEVQRIYAALNKRMAPGVRPFRSPHYSVSTAALLGGGAGDRVIPGEVSLAHNGVLFCDEAAQMPRSVIEALRGPIEDRKVVISRLKAKVEYPSSFMLVLASNPCPCGYYGEGDRCTCTAGQREAFLSRLYGPVYDRLTVQCWVHPNKGETIPGEPSSVVAERVRKARKIQMQRQGKLNEQLSVPELADIPFANDGTDTAMDYAMTLMERMGLSARACTRILRIARTIADLDGCAEVKVAHIAEAASYRFLDRQNAK